MTTNAKEPGLDISGFRGALKQRSQDIGWSLCIGAGTSLNALPDWATLVKRLSANPALARMYGYNSPRELIGALTDISGQLYVKPGRRAEFLKLIREHGKVIDFESQIYRRDKSVIWILESARLVHDEVSGEVLYYEGMVQDITQRKLAEEERDQANARLALQYAVTRTLAEVRHLGEASGKVVQSICETMSWDVGGLWYVDADANVLRCADVWYAPGVNVRAFIDATQWAAFAPGMGLLGACGPAAKHFGFPM
jgi:PAS domain S-box-containing protein